jgi:hypothetical protein
MAGGIFGDRPFTLNPKCIFFALVCMALFMYRPSFSRPIFAFAALTGVFWVAYIAMAWYDYYFNCDIVPLRKGQYSLQGLLKPPAHAPEKQYLPVGVPQGAIDASRDLTLIYLLHLVVIAPFIGYIAFMGRRTPEAAFWLLGAVTALTVMYHAAGAYTVLGA